MFEFLSEKGIKLNSLEELNLKNFENLLCECNNKFNLTAIKNSEDIEIKHFQDSLMGESLFPKNKKVVEVGSGGGFPSIPLMIKRNDLEFTLIESTGKKCEFLTMVVDKLKLNAKVINKRAEDVGKSNLRESFDIVTARAVASLNVLCEYCMPLIKVGGLFIAYKSVNDEIEKAKNAISILGGEVINVYNYSLSKGAGDRVIYVIKKVKNTPLLYPRGNGKERSKPL